MNSNQRFALMLAAMGLVGIALMRVSPVAGQGVVPQAATSVIRTKRIELVDRTGKVIGTVGTDTGAATIALKDEGGHDRVVLSANETNPIITNPIIAVKGMAGLALVSISEQYGQQGQIELLQNVNGGSVRMISPTYCSDGHDNFKEYPLNHHSSR